MVDTARDLYVASDATRDRTLSIYSERLLSRKAEHHARAHSGGRHAATVEAAGAAVPKRMHRRNPRKPESAGRFSKCAAPDQAFAKAHWRQASLTGGGERRSAGGMARPASKLEPCAACGLSTDALRAFEVLRVSGAQSVLCSPECQRAFSESRTQSGPTSGAPTVAHAQEGASGSGPVPEGVTLRQNHQPAGMGPRPTGLRLVDAPTRIGEVAPRFRWQPPELSHANGTLFGLCFSGLCWLGAWAWEPTLLWGAGLGAIGTAIWAWQRRAALPLALFPREVRLGQALTFGLVAMLLVVAIVQTDFRLSGFALLLLGAFLLTWQVACAHLLRFDELARFEAAHLLPSAGPVDPAPCWLIPGTQVPFDGRIVGGGGHVRPLPWLGIESRVNVGSSVFFGSVVLSGRIQVVPASETGHPWVFPRLSLASALRTDEDDPAPQRLRSAWIGLFVLALAVVWGWPSSASWESRLLTSATVSILWPSLHPALAPRLLAGALGTLMQMSSLYVTSAAMLRTAGRTTTLALLRLSLLCRRGARLRAALPLGGADRRDLLAYAHALAGVMPDHAYAKALFRYQRDARAAVESEAQRAELGAPLPDGAATAHPSESHAPDAAGSHSPRAGAVDLGSGNPYAATPSAVNLGAVSAARQDHGITGHVGTARVCLGTRTLLLSEGVAIAGAEQEARRWERLGCSVLLMAVGGRLTGLLAFERELRPSARPTMAGLKDLGIEVVLLSGEQRESTEALTQPLGLGSIRPELPESAFGEAIERLGSDGSHVAAVASGAYPPAFAQSALPWVINAPLPPPGFAGVLARMDDLRALPTMLHVARLLRRKGEPHLAWSFGLRAVLVLATALGLVGPMIIAVAVLGLELLLWHHLSGVLQKADMALGQA